MSEVPLYAVRGLDMSNEVPLYVVRGLDMSDTPSRQQEEENARGKLEEARMAEQVP